MALSEFEILRIQKIVGGYVESKRPEPHIRASLDIKYSISGQSFVIYEVRPNWRNPEEVLQNPVAKATFIKTKKVWRLYWMGSDLKWHRYEPLPDTGILERVVEEIDKDAHYCFWG